MLLLLRIQDQWRRLQRRAAFADELLCWRLQHACPGCCAGPDQSRVKAPA